MVARMGTMGKYRIFHFLLAVLAVASYYITHGWGLLHSWLGYGVVALVLFRLLWSTGGAPQLALARFLPDFSGFGLKNALSHPAIGRILLLGVVFTLLTCCVTGIFMDKGRAFDPAAASATVQRLTAGEGEAHRPMRLHREGGGFGQGRGGGHHREESVLKEVHELSANLMLGLAIAHALYLLLFRWPLARFMLFFPKPARAAS